MNKEDEKRRISRTDESPEEMATRHHVKGMASPPLARHPSRRPEVS